MSIIFDLLLTPSSITLHCIYQFEGQCFLQRVSNACKRQAPHKTLANKTTHKVIKVFFFFLEMMGVAYFRIENVWKKKLTACFTFKHQMSCMLSHFMPYSLNSKHEEILNYKVEHVIHPGHLIGLWLTDQRTFWLADRQNMSQGTSH